MENYTGKYLHIYAQHKLEEAKLKEEHSAAIMAGNENLLHHYLTKRRYDQFKSGEITPDQAKAFALVRLGNALEKWDRTIIARLNAIEVTAPVTSAGIVVQWKKSTTWGHNPHCEVHDGEKCYTGTASGCGYDKESSAMAEALNQSNGILRILCDRKEERLAELGIHATNENCLGYGAGYSPIPHFHGGVGVSSFQQIFKNCGYTLSNDHSGNYFDTYSLYKEVA